MEAAYKIYFKLWRLSIVLKSLKEVDVVFLRVEFSTTQLHRTKNFPLNNQCRVVEELQ